MHSRPSQGYHLVIMLPMTPLSIALKADPQVLQAVLITLGVFIGLTLFTLQTRLDFSSMYPFLFAGIWGIIAASLVQLFLPFNATADLVIAGFSVVLFSAFVLYDTQQIMKRLSVDEVVLGE